MNVQVEINHATLHLVPRSGRARIRFCISACETIPFCTLRRMSVKTNKETPLVLATVGEVCLI